MAFINESNIEEADIQFFELNLGYEHINAWEKKLIGRENLKEVVLKPRLKAKLKELNPNLPEKSLDYAILELTKSRATLEAVVANKEIYEIIKNRVQVKFKNEKGNQQTGSVKIIDFENPENNDFLVVSQLSIEYQRTEGITRRPDLIIYVNGLPLVMIELKNATEKVKQGYDKNLKDYKRDIPQLFWYNLFVVISNGHQTRVGAFSSEWEHFFNWVKSKDPSISNDQATAKQLEIESKSTDKKISLEVFNNALLNKNNLIDYFENFVLFHKNKAKIIAKNHQYLGVNNSIISVQNREKKQGKLGVFWHTQGSGKSYSMIFFARKIQRKITGDWSFLIITDRKNLDQQIYRNFKDTETLIETKAEKENYYRPYSRKKLQEFLQSNRTFVFTLIHKFGIEKGKTFPQLTNRDNWIVIVDEAHRTQYKALGDNLRIAMPNAQFIAFTGTPLLGNELTNKWFGDYVSEYNFLQSIEDGATVPLFYKKSVPRVVQINEDFNDEALQILEDENLSEEQIKKLDNEYSSTMQIIRREDRLKEIAKHIVKHYPYRLDVENDEGERKPMKAMVISIDKFTAVRMFEFVQEAQKEEIAVLMDVFNQFKEMMQIMEDDTKTSSLVETIKNM
ncbi:MAG: HsdR family type I site-specific deoxyribonuclease [Bacteroidota bacterium]|nr:HsdR family type I site-specific deoxyribonuclease [Bacteroidota bacterium]